MPGFLFNDVIFGPVRSRRLGLSLGVNLLPPGRKVCTFDCVYCECGWTHHTGEGGGFPDAGAVTEALRQRLARMDERGQCPDAITFAGNGEPTLHPDFASIMDATVRLRGQYFPEARIAVLTNGTRLLREDIATALSRADINMIKLDAGTEETFRRLNQVRLPLSLEQMLAAFRDFKGRYIIQTMFVKGEVDGIPIDNSSDQEVDAWIGRLKQLEPEYLTIYSLDRGTPIAGLEQVSSERLREIAGRVTQVTGHRVEVY